jgi:hypothetical protein
MAMEYKYGLMEHVMKENGNTIKPMVRGNSGMLMVMSLMENGETTKQMDMESILM